MTKTFLKLLTLSISMAVFMAVPFSAQAQIKKATVIGVPDDIERIKVNLGACAAPYFCEKRKTGVWTYNAQVWGNQKFKPGTVTLLDGTVITGQVAMIQREQDWEFLKHFALIVPEGETDAIYVGPGDAFAITRVGKKGEAVYDQYGRYYLKRLVSGPLRLSYNPAAGTTRNITEFLPAGFVEDIQREIAGREIIAAIKAGKNLSEVRDSGTASQAFGDVVASIEITEKEYLVYNEAAGTTTLITKHNHKQAMSDLFASCVGADAGAAKSHSKSFKKIVDAFEYLNATCQFNNTTDSFNNTTDYP